MRTVWYKSLLCATLLFVLTSCNSNIVSGMNEISLNKLENKIEENKSFLLVTFSADEADVEKSELVEAFEEVFVHKDKVAFFVNVKKDTQDEETLNQLGEEHTSTEDTDKAWQSIKHGIFLVHRGEIRKESSTALLESSNIKATANQNHGEKNSFYECTKNLDSEITDILDFMNKNDIRLHY